jgi:hypothetical protein
VKRLILLAVAVLSGCGKAGLDNPCAEDQQRVLEERGSPSEINEEPPTTHFLYYEMTSAIVVSFTEAEGSCEVTEFDTDDIPETGVPF